MKAYNMYSLLENKNHLIDRLNLTPDQKEKIKVFFAKHPSYENKIDWNNKSLQYKDFESILALDGKSKTQAKKRGIEGLVEGVDYEYLGCGNSRDFGNYILYQPLTYLGSMTLASNKVPPVKGSGAKWCIAYQKTDQYWNDYINRGIQFVFILTEDTKYAVVLYPAKEEARIEIYDFEDEQGDTYLLKRCPKLLKTLFSIRKNVPTTPEEWLKYYVSEGLLIEGRDGKYRNSPEQSKVRTIDATHLITDSGRLICDFDRWEGDFKFFFIDLVSSAGIEKLKSLEGCPKTVIGDFKVNFSQIESLEGGPIFVSGDYDCAHNPKLVSFKGAPEAVGGDFNTLGSFYKDLQDLEYFPKAIAGKYRISATNARLFLSPENRENLKKYPQIIKALKSVPEENISGSLRKELLEFTPLREAYEKYDPSIPAEVTGKVATYIANAINAFATRNPNTPINAKTVALNVRNRVIRRLNNAVASSTLNSLISTQKLSSLVRSQVNEVLAKVAAATPNPKAQKAQSENASTEPAEESFSLEHPYTFQRSEKEEMFYVEREAVENIAKDDFDGIVVALRDVFTKQKKVGGCIGKLEKDLGASIEVSLVSKFTEAKIPHSYKLSSSSSRSLEFKVILKKALQEAAKASKNAPGSVEKVKDLFDADEDSKETKTPEKSKASKTSEEVPEGITPAGLTEANLKEIQEAFCKDFSSRIIQSTLPALPRNSVLTNSKKGFASKVAKPLSYELYFTYEATAGSTCKVTSTTGGTFSIDIKKTGVGDSEEAVKPFAAKALDALKAMGKGLVNWAMDKGGVRVTSRTTF